MDKVALIEPAVVYSILSYVQMRHPREAILLLKGKIGKHRIVINDTQIPPLATHGNTFPLVAKRDMFGYFNFKNLSFYINFELKNHAISPGFLVLKTSWQLPHSMSDSNSTTYHEAST